MLQFFKPVKSLGLDCSSSILHGAELEQKNGKTIINRLFSSEHPTFSENVKRLYKANAFIATALDGPDVLVRPLTIPLIKDKDVEAALAFQAEPGLPYPIEEALLARQTLLKNSESTQLSLLSTRKNLLQAHLDQWQKQGIEPEIVASLQSALCQFIKTYFEADKAYLLLHIQDQSSTCVLIDSAKIIASFSQPEGLHLLYHAYKADSAGKQQFPSFDKINYSTLDQKITPHIVEAVTKLQKMAALKGLAILKELRGKPCEGILVTGEAASLPGLDIALTHFLNQPLLQCPAQTNYTSQQLQTYAVPIGLALGSLPKNADPINFRQQELSFPYPWKRLTKPLVFYFIAMLGLSASFYLFSQSYMASEEVHLKQEYLNLLGKMNKPYDQFETIYLTKNPAEKKGSEITPIAELTRDELHHRLSYLQKDLLATPDSFPLHANIPRVSDMLAWLAQHPTVVGIATDDLSEPRIQIENFNYTLVKRPMLGKKTEKYQVKVEIEFSSPTPKYAREFHDALIAPNDWIDPKGEVKWSSNRGKYKTSFFLKDKTSYHGL